MPKLLHIESFTRTEKYLKIQTNKGMLYVGKKDCTKIFGLISALVSYPMIKLAYIMYKPKKK